MLAGVAAAATPAPAAALVTQLQETDTIVGAGSNGPYYLARTGIMAYSETVIQDSQRLVPGIDYNLDPTLGSIVFTQGIPAGGQVTVRYSYDPAVSKAASNSLSSTSLDIPLLGVGPTSMHMVGQYQGGARGQEASQGLSDLGLAMSQTVGRAATFGATVLMDPHAMPSTSNGAGINSQSAAVQLSSQFNLAGLKLTGQWANANRSYSGASTVPAAPGSTATSLAVAGKMSPGVSIDAGYTAQRPTSGTDTTHSHVSLGVNTFKGGAMSLSGSESVTGEGPTATNATAYAAKGNVTPGVSVDAGYTTQDGAGSSQASNHVSVGVNTFKGGALNVSRTETDSGTGATAANSTAYGVTGKVTPGVSVDAGYTTHDGAGSSQASNHVAIGIATVNGGSVNLSRSQSLTGAGSTGTQNNTTEVSVNQKFGSRAQLALDEKRVAGESGGALQAQTIDQVSLSLTPVAGMQVNLGEMRNNTRGQADNLTHSLGLNYGKLVQAQASLQQQDPGHGDASTIGNLSLQAQPTAALSLGTTQAFTQDAHGLAQRSRSVTAGYTDGSLLKVQGLMGDNYTRGGAYQQSQQVSMGLSPVKQVSVNGQFQENMSTTAGAASQRSVQVVVGDKSPVKVGANLSEQFQGHDSSNLDLIQETRGATIAVDPLKALHLGAGYSENMTADSSQRNRTVETTLAPVAALAVTGRYVERTSTTGDIPDTTSFGLNLKPLKTVSVQGTYTQNPDNAAGQVTPSTQQSVALTTQLGFVDLSGKYSLLDTVGCAAPARQTQLNLSLSLSKTTRLYGDYNYANQRTSPTDGLYQYQVGFSRKVGDYFDLLLSGQVQTNSAGMDGVRDGLQNNAQAKVGLSAHW
jgi:hypothetical protein